MKIIITKEMIQNEYTNATAREYSTDHKYYANSQEMYFEFDEGEINITIFSEFTNIEQVLNEIRNISGEILNPVSLYEGASYRDKFYSTETEDYVEYRLTDDAHEFLVELSKEFSLVTREYQIEDIERKIEQATSDYNEYHSRDNATD